MATEAAARHGIPEFASIVIAMTSKESGERPDAIGDSGHSVGLLQLHDRGQGAGMTVEQRKDPYTNLDVGVRNLAASYRHFGNIEAAIASHNAGRPAVDAMNGDWERLYGGSVANGYVRPILALAKRIERGEA